MLNYRQQDNNSNDETASNKFRLNKSCDKSEIDIGTPTSEMNIDVNIQSNSNTYYSTKSEFNQGVRKSIQSQKNNESREREKEKSEGQKELEKYTGIRIQISKEKSIT